MKVFVSKYRINFKRCILFAGDKLIPIRCPCCHSKLGVGGASGIPIRVQVVTMVGLLTSPFSPKLVRLNVYWVAGERVINDDETRPGCNHSHDLTGPKF